MNQKNPNPRRTNIHWIWWVIALALLVWNIVVYLPKGTTAATLPYSQFMQFVNSGNVASVQISGSTITGQFVNPVPSTQISTPSPQSTSSTSSSSTVTTYTNFTTTFPDTQGDPNFTSTLLDHNVVINVSPPPSPILSFLLSYILPLLLLVAVMFWILRRSSVSQSGIMNIGRSKAREYTVDQPQVTFDDVAGVDEAKQELQEIVDFLRRPDKYHKIGARIPKGVLLVGPPGTGKTLMAKAIAGEAGVPFFSISASEFVEMFVGVGASRVRDLFEKAKASSPAIVFIDELETIIIAATNRPDVLDPALLRPGRFDRQVTVGLPDRRGRERILQIHTRSLNLGNDVNLDILARSTTGFSGADLANICNEAALNAARESQSEIHQLDFEVAVDRVLLGAKRSLALNEEQRTIIAYHESGHALVAWLTPQADPVNKVTIIPRGRALGVTEQLPGEDQYNFDKEYLLARLAVMMGGRVSEEIALKDITTGAENDLAEATRLARRMITRWGMGSLGPMAISTDEEQPFLGYEISQGREYSEEVAAQIDKNIQQLLKERYEYARQLLLTYRDKLDLLVRTLLQEETIQYDDIVRVLGPRTAEVTDSQPA
jgi:cell division protease FtsH